jgi:hypothetical protein
MYERDILKEKLNVTCSLVQSGYGSMTMFHAFPDLLITSSNKALAFGEMVHLSDYHH